MYVRTYIDNLLLLTKGAYKEHLEKLRSVLSRLRDANLRVKAPKSTFAASEIEYLGYILTRDGIKPQPEKILAILAIEPPQNVKQLRRFLGMVQYYRDMWEKRSHLIAPLTDLISDCGQTKTTKKIKHVKSRGIGHTVIRRLLRRSKRPSLGIYYLHTQNMVNCLKFTQTPALDN